MSRRRDLCVRCWVSQHFLLSFCCLFATDILWSCLPRRWRLCFYAARYSCGFSRGYRSGSSPTILSIHATCYVTFIPMTSMRFAKCRFPLVHVLDTKSAFHPTCAPFTPLVRASSHTGGLPERSPCIAPAPLRCDDKCSACLHLLGAPTSVGVPVTCQCPFQIHLES